MPSELNLTEAGLSSHSSSFDLKHPGTRASITPRAEFSGLFLTGPANGMLPKPLTDLSRCEKLFFFVKTSDRSEIMYPMATALHLFCRRSFR